METVAVEQKLQQIYDVLLLIFIVLSVYCGYSLADKIVRRR